MSRRRLAPLLSVAPAIALIAVALTGFGSELSRATTSSRESDTQAAKRAVLGLRDLPSGWERGEQPESREILCPAFAAVRRNASGRASSPRMVDPASSAEVGATVARFADVDAAKRSFRALAGHATTRCYADQAVKLLKKNGASGVGELSTRPLSVERLGDERAGVRFVVPFTAEGDHYDLSIDLTYVRSGRGLSLVFFLDPSGAFDGRLRHDLIAKQAGRLAT
jgi:hypothetical protein